MPDHPRIEELRRRLTADPLSMAFSALAEELWRAGHNAQAIETCRAGLARYPTHVSARITLGRALLEIGEPVLARVEIERVLCVTPRSIPAIRGLADIEYRRGHLIAAIELYRQALDLATRGPNLLHTLDPIDGDGDPEIVQAPPDTTLGRLERLLSRVQVAHADRSRYKG